MEKNHSTSLLMVRVWGPIKIAGIYLALGVLWIFFSDRLTALIAPDEVTFARISTYKGWGFVIVTALLLYLLIRRHTDTALAHERQLSLITDALPALISYVDSNGYYRFNNDAYRKWFGSEATGKHVEELVGKKVYQTISHHVETALSGEFVKYETRLPHRDGSERFVSASYVPDMQDNGRVRGFFALVQDLTERKRAEEALEKSYRQLLSFIEQAPLSIAMFDREMNYLATSRLWVAEFGRGYTDLVGCNHYQVHPDIPKQWMDAHKKGLAGETLRNDDDVWIQADGTKVWLRWAVTPWMDEDGQIGGITITTEDISQRKRAEADAFQNNMRYHRLLDAMLEGCQLVDFDWRYVYVNDVAAEQGRRKPGELLGHTMMEMYPGIENTELFSVLRKCMQGREPNRMQNRFVFPDGSIGWFELSIQPAQEGLFILSTDITEHRQAEEEIHRLNRELEARIAERTLQLETANRELESFASSVSHRLREPLRAIGGFTRILEADHERSLGEEGKRIQGIIRNETERMGMLLDDLLAFSGLSRIHLRPTGIDMRVMADEVFQEMVAGQDGRKIEFVLGELPSIRGDAGLMRRVWTNLLGNAVKFTSGRRRTVIEVKSTQSADEVVFSVSDNGTGFDMGHADRLFGVFQRLHNQEEFEGSGVGLAIVQKVIHRHGGKVWAEGRVDMGAMFYFALPREGGDHELFSGS